MPLTFAQAYAIVCPDARPVAPGSKDAYDIAELMRQSGYKHYTETIVQESAPRVPRNEMEARSFIETPRTFTSFTNDTGKKPFISRKQWMSVEVNKIAFIKALNKNKPSS